MEHDKRPFTDRFQFPGNLCSQIIQQLPCVEAYAYVLAE